MSLSALQNAPFSSPTFTQFLFQNRRNRIILYLSAIAIVLQFTVFKYLYPYANYIHGDSFSYLKAAEQNLTISTYPIGYPKFLRLISVFAKPDFVLVSIQYLLIQCSTLFLLFSIFYFYKAGRVMQAILFCFMVFNPLSLHLANMVSSDGLFLALSMTWFALLLWITHKPSSKIICWHAIVLFAAFTVRYNALIYPFIAALAFGLSKLPFRKKVTGLGLGLFLCCWLVAISMFQYKKLTGYWQFSPFSGWQLANNAMYVYPEVDSADREPVPPQFRTLNNMIRKFYDNNPILPRGEASTAYMWTEWLPLRKYSDSLFSVKNSSETKFKKWASMGPLYSSYGMYFIKKHPRYFLRHFVLPNSVKYFLPPVEYLGYYNWNHPTVPESAVKWFGYTNNQVKTRMKSGKVSILTPYPYLVCIANLTMLLILLAYLLLKGWQNNTTFNKIILLAGFIWIANAGFTIFAASTALRFLTFPALLSVTFSLILMTGWSSSCST
jgi:hypothetical protein